jgi:hypothetical protein
MLTKNPLSVKCVCEADGECVGNNYGIDNPGSTTALLFFAQGSDLS